MTSMFSFFGLFRKKNILNNNFKVTELKSGQIWKYNTRTAEKESRILILRVEQINNKDTIVHIEIKKTKIKNFQNKNGVSEEIGHLAFLKTAIVNSLIELESSGNKLPNYLANYNQWKRAFDNGNGIIFSNSIIQAINHIEQSINP